MPIKNRKIILASGSKIRKKLLEDAGINFEVIKSDVDEDALKPEIKHMTILEQATFLATKKALDVSSKNPDKYVIGADTICTCEGKIFNKPGSHDIALKQLGEMQGKTHTQNTGCVIVLNGEIIWSHAESAKIKMKSLSKNEIEDYLNLDQPYQSAGSYHFEDNGYKLFEEIDGSEECIMGLPLSALLLALKDFCNCLPGKIWETI